MSSPISSRSRASRTISLLGTLVPGVLLTGGLAAVSQWLQLLPYLGLASPLLIAVLIGIVIQNTVGTSALFRPGVQFSGRTLLRTSIVLLGLRLTAADLLAVDPVIVAIVVAGVASTLVFTIYAGRVLGVEAGLAQLIAMGTSICGASAIAAANVVTQASEEKVTYALIIVTLFGTIAMLLYPLFSSWIGLDPMLFGMWSGASIHEVAQVVGAAFQGGTDAGEIGTIVKLGRVVLLAPAILALSLWLARGTSAVEREGKASPLPGFIILFLVVIALNSIFDVPAPVREVGTMLSAMLMIMALGALGLGADFAKLRLEGPRPLLLGMVSTAFIGVLTLTLLVLLT